MDVALFRLFVFESHVPLGGTFTSTVYTKGFQGRRPGKWRLRDQARSWLAISLDASQGLADLTVQGSGLSPANLEAGL